MKNDFEQEVISLLTQILQAVTDKPLIDSPRIPEDLSLMARGRDLLLLNEVAAISNTAPQTIRKHLCQTGHFHGIKPIKIGGRIQFAIKDIEKLIKGKIH